MEFTISTVLSATPAQVYTAWLDSEAHSNMTGGEAHASNEVGGQFTAWDGYINGTNIALVKDQHIIQDWRTSEFRNEEENSHIEIDLEATDNGCQITLHHSNLPAHGMQYKQGWVDNYFTPMKEYFDSI